MASFGKAPLSYLDMVCPWACTPRSGSRRCRACLWEWRWWCSLFPNSRSCSLGDPLSTPSWFQSKQRPHERRCRILMRIFNKKDAAQKLNKYEKKTSILLSSGDPWVQYIRLYCTVKLFLRSVKCWSVSGDQRVPPKLMHVAKPSQWVRYFSIR